MAAYPRHLPLGYVLSGATVIIIELVLLAALELLGRTKSKFIARKGVHVITGFLLLVLDSRDEYSRLAVLAISLSSLLMTWGFTEAIGIPSFSFGKKRDVGITIYLIMVLFVFGSSLPAAILSPMFFADPAGALVGKQVRSRKLLGNKSVAGTSAVFVTLVLTLFYLYPPMPTITILFLSALGAVAELYGGEYDNLAIAAAVIGCYFSCV